MGRRRVSVQFLAITLEKFERFRTSQLLRVSFLSVDLCKSFSKVVGKDDYCESSFNKLLQNILGKTFSVPLQLQFTGGG